MISKVMLKQSIETGLVFGSNTGIITALGLIVGLYTGTHSESAVLGGILMIAIADSFSDALGIHMSEESDTDRSEKEIWESTISTLISKTVFTLSLAAPIFLFDLETAVVIDLIWGLFLIGATSFYISKIQNENPLRVLLEHLSVAVLVMGITHFIGRVVGKVI